jgi:hypothetical protein
VSRLPRSLPIVTLPAGSKLWRIHKKHRDPIWFGPAPGAPPRNRFDAPAGEYGTCYFGDSPEVAFAETLIRGLRARMVTRAQLDEQHVSSLPVLRELKLAQVHGAGLVRLGIGAEVVHGHPYAQCQALALDIWKHPAAVDGIQYRSRWDNDRLCIALFDRAESVCGPPSARASLSEPSLILPMLKLYDVGVV